MEKSEVAASHLLAECDKFVPYVIMASVGVCFEWQLTSRNGPRSTNDNSITSKISYHTWWWKIVKDLLGNNSVFKKMAHTDGQGYATLT